MSQEKDKLFFRNFSLVVGLLAVLMVVFIIAARIVGIDEAADVKRRAAAVAEATAPMGEASVTGEADEEAVATVETTATQPEAAEGGETGSMGKKVYDGLCVSCHGLGPAMAAMIPQFGDKEAWAPRIAQGNETLYKHAIEGFSGSGGMAMPPRGGGDLSDEEVKAAVDYMVESSM